MGAMILTGLSQRVVSRSQVSWTAPIKKSRKYIALDAGIVIIVGKLKYFIPGLFSYSFCNNAFIGS